MNNRKSHKLVVLIGGLGDIPGALPTITQSIMDSELLQENFRFISHYASRTKGLGTQGAFNVTNLTLFLRHYAGWIQMLARHRPELAHYPVTSYWNFPKSVLFLLSAKLFGCKAVGHLHGGEFDLFWTGMRPISRVLGKCGLNLLDGLIVLGRKWMDLMVEAGLRSPLFILPNPIESDFSTRKFPDPFASPQKRLLFVGSIGYRKGVPVLLEAAGKLVKQRQDFHLKLVGSEERNGYMREMKEMASRLLPAGSYEFTGPIYGNQKIEQFSRSDVFVFPSNNENLPLVIIEAMAASRPIICTPVGAVPEYLSHGVSALFTKPNDPENLAKHIEWMFTHPHQSIEMGKKAGMVYQERLRSEAVMAKLESVYFSILRREPDGFRQSDY
ncbi:MAG: glycosyltransferase family 4 protein [Pseudomonadota bacterium]